MSSASSLKVYIAGPYSKGETAINVRNAILAGDKVLEMGYSPFIPHLTHFWHYISPKPWATWLKIDQDWLRICDVVLRLPGESTGADIEVNLAKILGIPVVYSFEELGKL